MSTILELATYSWLPEHAELLTIPGDVYEALKTVEDAHTTNPRTASVAMAITDTLLGMATEIGLVAGREHPAFLRLAALDSQWAGGRGPEQVYDTLHDVAGIPGIDPVVVSALRCLSTIVTDVTNWNGNAPDGADMRDIVGRMAVLMRAYHITLGEDASRTATSRLVEAIRQA